jgi:hypothetical protein
VEDDIWEPSRQFVCHRLCKRPSRNVQCHSKVMESETSVILAVIALPCASATTKSRPDNYSEHNSRDCISRWTIWPTMQQTSCRWSLIKGHWETSSRQLDTLHCICRLFQTNIHGHNAALRKRGTPLVVAAKCIRSPNIHSPIRFSRR